MANGNGNNIELLKFFGQLLAIFLTVIASINVVTGNMKEDLTAVKVEVKEQRVNVANNKMKISLVEKDVIENKADVCKITDKIEELPDEIINRIRGELRSMVDQEQINKLMLEDVKKKSE